MGNVVRKDGALGNREVVKPVDKNDKVFDNSIERESKTADAIGHGEKLGNIRTPGKDGVAGTSDDVRNWDLDNDGFDSDNHIPASRKEDAGDPAPSHRASSRESDVAHRDGEDAPRGHGHRRKVRNQSGDKFTGQFHYEYE